MTAKQTWALIGAVWVIAISLFMIGLQRYGYGGNNKVTYDKWTGTILLGKIVNCDKGVWVDVPQKKIKDKVMLIDGDLKFVSEP